MDSFVLTVTPARTWRARRPKSPRALLAAAALLLLTLVTTSGAMAQAKVQQWTHPTGIRLFLAENHTTPYVTFRATFDVGGLDDPRGQSGLATLTAGMMLRGSQTHDYRAFQQELALLGATAEVESNRTYTSIEGDVLARNTDKLFALLADGILTPKLDPEEYARFARKQETSAIKVRDDDKRLAARIFDRYLFANHPYGRPADGTLRGIRAVTIEDIRAFHERQIHSGEVLLGFSGDIDRTKVDQIVDTYFASIRRQKPDAPKHPPLPTLTGRRVVLVDKPDRTQTQILVGHKAPKADTDVYALEVANSLFGGTFTARLNKEIRDKRGLSYGAYSYLEQDRFGGMFSMWSYPSADDALKTLALTLRLYDQLRSEPLTEEEVETSKSFLINSFAFRVDTPDKALMESMDSALQGLPPDYLERYVDKVRATTATQVNAAIKAHLDPSNVLIVMLCTAAMYEGPLKELDDIDTIKVIPYDIEL